MSAFLLRYKHVCFEPSVNIELEELAEVHFHVSFVPYFGLIFSRKVNTGDPPFHPVRRRKTECHPFRFKRITFDKAFLISLYLRLK